MPYNWKFYLKLRKDLCENHANALVYVALNRKKLLTSCIQRLLALVNVSQHTDMSYHQCENFFPKI